MKKIIIGLLTLVYASSFAEEVQLRVTKCHYHVQFKFIGEPAVSYKCKDKTDNSLGQKITQKLELAGFHVSDTANKVLSIEIFNPGPFSQTQNGRVTKRAIAIIKDLSGATLRHETVEAVTRPLASIEPILDAAVSKIANLNP